MRGRKRQRDGFEHGVGVDKHVMIPEPDDSVSGSIEERRSSSILLDRLSMLPAIDFNNQLLFNAAKVHNVWPQRMLASAFEVCQLPPTEQVPE